VTTAERLMEDMKTSMKAGDAGRTGVLRLLRAALKNEEIKQGKPLEEPEALKVLQREAKQRRDSAEAYRVASRADSVDQEETELVIISEYLPTALTENELTQIVNEVVSELGATDVKQTGQVIGAVMSRVGARADGGAVAKAVRARLSS
jgi:uncharacterized protein YqeY